VGISAVQPSRRDRRFTDPGGTGNPLLRHVMDPHRGRAGQDANIREARALATDARDMLGGNGILLDYQVMRHMVDLEVIHTFESTETMQTLIVGRAITGIGAFR
jgi:hypothetical protein